MELSNNEYYMIPIGCFYEMESGRVSFREIEEYIMAEEHKFVDFEDMYTLESVNPFGKVVKKNKKKFLFNGASDYYKDYFVTANPEDNDGVISGDEISSPSDAEG